MGKTGKQLKKRRLAAQAATLPNSPPDQDSSDNNATTDFLDGLISPLDLASAVATLQTLTTHSHLLKNKHDLKALRGAVFDFQRISNELSGTGTTLISRISAALSSSRHTDALVLLSELHIRGGRLPLGTLQRWVRDCDAASRSDGSFGDANVLRVLDAILRCADAGTGEGGGVEETMEGGKGKVEKEPVKKMETWCWRKNDEEEDLWKEIQEGRFPPVDQRDALASRFSLLHETPASERLPPNLHPALLFHSQPSTIPLSPTPPSIVTRVPVPHVPGAFLLTDLLSPEECRSILAHAESVGFKPDEPIGVEEGDSVLAHNLYWLADRDFLDTFCKRFLHLVPQESGGGVVSGINARFRVYRYVPGAIYRPHIDGAWPASGVHPTTGEYLYNSSPPEESQWSRLTFLIYLNSNFSSGQTTFFLPSPTTTGQLNAYPVKPVTGCALVFPHGDAIGSLLHEGSPVGEGGAKYVIRTEVLYRKMEAGSVVAEVGEKEEKDGL